MITSTWSTQKLMVGTEKKSMAHDFPTWLRRNVSQDCDLLFPPWDFTMYFLIVSGQGGSKPRSLRWPWIRSALHKTFSLLSLRIRSSISRVIGGRPPFRRDFQLHQSLKILWCQRMTVSARITQALLRQPDQTLERMTQRNRNPD